MTQASTNSTFHRQTTQVERARPVEANSVEFLNVLPPDLTTNAKRIWIEQLTETLNFTVDGIDIHTLSDRIDLGYVVPQWFGAIANGVADDTVPIQNAINFAALHGITGVLFIGSYLYSDTLSIPSNITLFSLGAATIKTAANFNKPAISVVGDNVSIRNLTLDGNKFNQNYVRADTIAGHFFAPAILSLRRNHLKIEGCTFQNWYFDCIATDAGDYGLISKNFFSEVVGNPVLLYLTQYTTVPRYWMITENTLIDIVNDVDGTGDWGNGVLVNNGQHITISNNHFDNIDRDGIKLESGLFVVVEGNDFQRTGFHGVAAQPNNTAPNQIVINSNTFGTGKNAGIFINGDGLRAKNITIVGNNMKDPGQQQVGSFIQHGIYLRDAEDVEVSGNTVINPNRIGIYVFELCTRINITNNVVNGGIEGSIVILGQTNYSTHVLIANNTVRNTVSWGIAYNGGTAFVTDNANIQFLNNTITGAVSVDPLLSPIRIHSPNTLNLNALVEGNSIFGGPMYVNSRKVYMNRNTCDTDMVFMLPEVYGQIMNESRQIDVNTSPFTANALNDTYIIAFNKNYQLNNMTATGNKQSGGLGKKITYIFKSDAIGGYTITWGSLYRTDVTGVGSANKTLVVSFQFDGTLWRQIYKTDWMT